MIKACIIDASRSDPKQVIAAFVNSAVIFGKEELDIQVKSGTSEQKQEARKCLVEYGYEKPTDQEVKNGIVNSVECKNGGEMEYGRCKCPVEFGGVDCSVDLRNTIDYSSTQDNSISSSTGLSVELINYASLILSLIMIFAQ